MRIRRLELKAFGPFTDRVLAFPGDTPGLHVIYGPNEAGKSSTLRALTALLYGFPERTSDNFLHPNDQLLVAGLLENGRGEELYFARRKKRKADLLDAAGNPLDPMQLASLLQGIGQEAFLHLFGLDHETLVNGGTAILQEKGSAGTTLFSAGTGIASLRQILTDLRSESDEIFKGRASKPHLNAALRELNALKSEIHKASLSGREYQGHDKALRQAKKELEQAQVRRGELSREQRRLERIRQALKPLGVRRQLRAQLCEIGEVRPLPDDFSDRRKDSQHRLRAAGQTLAAATQRLEDLKQKSAAIDLNTALLDQSKTIAHLTQRLGEYRKGLSDLPLLEGKRVQAKTEAGNSLDRIRPDLSLEQADTLRPLLRRRRGIKDLGGRLPLLQEKAESTRRRLSDLQGEKETARAELKGFPPLRDLTPLKTAIARVQALGNIDREHAACNRDLHTRQSNFASELKRAGLWSGTAEELLVLGLPLAETIERFVKESRSQEDERKIIQKERHELGQEKKRLTLEISAIEKAGDVPTEKELADLRAHRDRGWQMLRRQWLNGEDISLESRAYHENLTLPEAYEQSVNQADATADRLRREAGRVHKYAHLVARAESIASTLQEIDKQETTLEARSREFQDRWRQGWQTCGIVPLSPEEMSGWLGRIEQLRIKAGQIVDEQGRVAALEKERREVLENLRENLASLHAPIPGGEALAPVLKVALGFQEHAEKAERRRQSLQDQLAELDKVIACAVRDAEQAQQSLADWQGEWREVREELGLGKKESPEDVEDFFEGLLACLNQLEKADEYHKRSAGIRRDSGQLTREVQALLQRVAPELVSLPLDQAVEQVGGLLSRTREQEATLLSYRDGIAQTENEIRCATADQQKSAAHLAELCALAGCAHQEGLEEAERRWQESQRLEERIAAEDERLLELAGGQPLTEFEDQVAGIDPDALPDQLRTLTEDLELVNQRISELSESIGIERGERARMNGSAEAAQKAEQAEEKLAEIRRLANHYTCLQIAAKVLEDEIERYRAENQDPVLKLASGYFAELTLGSFEGLRTDVDEKGEQVIVGLRGEGGERVVVDAMSSGTRDQLFLALRLASLEHRQEQGEAMPFIVDDILINFDEARSEATLKALARLAVKNQVILFTHHRQVAELAEGSEAQLISLV